MNRYEGKITHVTTEELFDILRGKISIAEALELLNMVQPPERKIEHKNLVVYYEAYKRLVDLGAISTDEIYTPHKENKLNDVGLKGDEIYRWDGTKWVNL